MKIIDLSGPIESGMWSYGPPLPGVSVIPVASMERDGWSAHSLQLHTLAGTYIETAGHVFPGRETIDRVGVERFVRKAWVARLPEKQPLEPVTAEELEQAAGGLPISPGDALLVSTGWDRFWNQENFAARNPYFEPGVMEWIIGKDVGILGVDLPSVQNPLNDNGDLVRRFFEKDRLLLAPLVHLGEAGPGPYTLIALPLRIPGVCGTPCRAILLEENIR